MLYVQPKTPIIEECLQHFNFLKKDITSNVALFAVMEKYGNRINHYFISNEEELEALMSKKNKSLGKLGDYYISPNSFFVRRRVYKFLHKLGCLYVDIDNHSTEITSHEVEALIFHLEKEYFGTKVPQPSMIVFSGRGVQLYWKLKPLSYNDMFYEFWKKMEKGIINNMIDLDFNGFRVDKQVCDAPRVLRLAGTYNVSAGKFAQIIYISNTTYTLTEISQGYVYGGITTGKEYVKRSKKKKSSKKSKKPRIDYSNENLLLQLRLEDLYKLINLRRGDVEGHRQYIVWMVANILKQLNVCEEELRSRLYEVNGMFTSPLPEREIENEFGDKKIYRFTNQTLIENLEITEYEQMQLSVIKSNGLTKKQATKEKKELLMHNVEKLFCEGKTQKQIAAHENVQCSERTVRTYLKNLGLSRKSTTYSQIQALKAEGYTQKEIADIIGKSAKTVKKYLEEKNDKNILH